MPDAPEYRFAEVGGGRLTVGHRPKLKSLPALRAAGVTHLVTLLSEREGAPAVGRAAEAAGLVWVWVELPGAGQPEPERAAVVAAALDGLVRALAAGATMLVHCSAGIHRTGMFGYALLRAAGLAPPQAAAALAHMRPVTAEGVGEHRLAWGELLAGPLTRR